MMMIDDWKEGGRWGGGEGVAAVKGGMALDRPYLNSRLLVKSNCMYYTCMILVLVLYIHTHCCCYHSYS